MSSTPTSTCFVVKSNGHQGQQWIFGKNSDRPQGEVQEILFLPKQNFPEGSKLKCTYIEIDQVLQSNSIILSKPSWMWGAEMGANEYDVCIGLTSIRNSKLISELDEDKRLLGQDLLRLALERSKTASEAVKIIANLLKIYGQGGSSSVLDPKFIYFSGFLIIDPKEVWILETVSKNEFAAQRIDPADMDKDSCIFRIITNCYTIGNRIDLCSENLKQFAKNQNLWSGSDDEEFNFSKIFNENPNCCSNKNDNNLKNRFESGKKLLEELTKDNNFGIKSMINVLRDKSIYNSLDDPFPTASSQVSVISASDSDSTTKCNRPSVHWFTGTPDPEYSYFKPFVFHPSVKIASQKVLSQSSNNANQSLSSSIDCKDIDYRHLLFKKHEEFYDKLKLNNDLHQTLRQIENLCIDELQQMLQDYNELDAQQNEIDNLFSDSVESELRFYR